MVKDAEGKEASKKIASWTSTGTAREITGLVDGTYELEESQAPLGYATAETITFVIKDGKLVEDENSKGGTVTMKDELNKTDVKISKVDAAGGQELKGAELTVTMVKDAEGKETSKEIASWTSTGKAQEVTDLVDGTYELEESQAPLGYLVAEKITFVIKDGKLVEDENSKGGTVTMKDEKTKITVSKVDIANSKEVAGAKIQILDEEDKVVAEWVSEEGKVEEITGLVTGVTYTLHEEVAPAGYTIASDTTFTIDEEGNVSGDATITEDGVILVEDTKTVIHVSKVDIADGKELSGAHIQILDEDGKVVVEWDSEEGKVEEITGLTTGVTYTLRETVAPDGYAVTSDTTFTIDEEGNVTSDATVTEDGVILVEDAMTRTKILKCTGDGKILEGAALQILDGDGAVIAEWTTENGFTEVVGLPVNVDLTLHEVSAPKGYELAKDILFRLDEKGKIVSAKNGEIVDGVLVMVDKKIVPKTDKKVKTGDMNDALLWQILMCAAAVSAGGLVVLARKKEEE